MIGLSAVINGAEMFNFLEGHNESYEEEASK